VLTYLFSPGYDVKGICVDVSTDEGRLALVSESKNLFGKLDCLINNVGSNRRKKVRQ
jgi:NAD(P)-dependent dehydrogenase (short-subunit alcohol dehydrogenase family)